jgi:hypothetical protein
VWGVVLNKAPIWVWCSIIFILQKLFQVLFHSRVVFISFVGVSSTTSYSLKVDIIDNQLLSQSRYHTCCKLIPPTYVPLVSALQLKFRLCCGNVTRIIARMCLLDFPLIIARV